MAVSDLHFGTPAANSHLRVVRELDELREGLDQCRSQGQRIVLVPTMGNLHAGHMALVRAARELGDLVITTIFVNPFQFAPTEDFDSYPRTFETDLQMLAEHGCDVVFAPSGDVVYPLGPDEISRVSVPGLGDILCGASRPGFFRGVATVVNILLNMVQPQVAMFGEKDYQQLLIVRRMVADLKLRVKIESVATVRESDGLAMSSRNGYLTIEERARAPVLYQVLTAARAALLSGQCELGAIRGPALSKLAEAGFEADYFEVRRRLDLSHINLEDGAHQGQLIVLAAAKLGSARLIDNIIA
ncbi:MAG: pantoate--beta-alanine ligase [Gammaproteobacteria bacterium]|jgi:pantoate--beta-alanine ligase